jgi:GGDEF domain-containing protein
MNHKNFRFSVVLISLCCLLLPVAVLILAVCACFVPDMYTMNTLMTATAFSAFASCAGGIILLLVFLDKLKKWIKQLNFAIDKLFSPEETAALEEKSQGITPDLVISALEYAAVMKNRGLKFKADSRLGNVSLRHTRDIVWVKENGQSSFLMYIPEYWRKTYPALTLSERDNLYTYIDPESASALKTALTSAESSAKKMIRMRVLLKVSAAHNTYVMVNASSQQDESGQFVVSGSLTDVDAREKIENMAAEVRGMYDFVMEGMEDLIFETDVMDDYVTVPNPQKWNEIFEFTYEDGRFLPQQGRFLELIHPDYREAYLDHFSSFNSLINAPEARTGYEFRIRSRYKEFIWVEQTSQVVSLDNGRIKRVISRIRNVSERKYHEMFSQDIRRRDTLTNTLIFSEARSEFLYCHSKDRNLPLILVNLHGIRDMLIKYGGETVDQVLKQVAETCREIAGPAAVISRDKKGEGGEFILFIPSEDPGKSTADFVGKITAAYENPLQFGKYTLSLHIEVITDYGDSFDRIYAAMKKQLNKYN